MKFPNALAIIVGFVLFAGILTYVIPQGEFDRVKDEESGREMVVEGSYHQVEADRLSPFDILLTIPRGIEGRADLIVLIFLIGGAFVVIDKTGALASGIDYLAGKVAGKEWAALVALSGVFTFGGVVEGMQEELIGMIPVILLLGRKLKYNALAMLSVSFGSAVVGAAFSPMNPFSVVIAQEVADLPFLSGFGYRFLMLMVAFALWTWISIRYAFRNKTDGREADAEVLQSSKLSGRHLLILVLIPAAFALLVIGFLKLDWGFEEMSAEFFVVGILAGLIGGLGINGTSEAYIQGFRDMTFACMVVGVANSISLVLKDGTVIDTIVYGLFTPLKYLPSDLSAIGMMVAQSALHFPVPSYSGQAILTMPILIPLSDLLHISRQVCILAYQYGAVMMDLILPTNGTLMAIIAIAGISYGDWFKFIWRKIALILLLGAIAILVAHHTGF
ncbi:MAG TPA: Na+/H+ antiporter NhaC family protein [Saprospiraceae bacterium]|nr:Na+/H+ antiporter NhaC family protein [Saprospiraceae bacterium]